MTTSNGENVLIAEDHELYRDGLVLMVKELMREARIHLASDFSQTLERLSEAPEKTLLLLDLHMPGNKNLEGLKTIRQRYPMLTIIVISTLDFDTSIRQIIDLGANGFIAKSTEKEAMKQAITDILEGDIVIKSERDGQEITYFSAQQLATLKCLAEGLSNKEIAARLGVSPLTIKEYVSAILGRLQASNRTQAVLIAQKKGLLLEYLM